MNRRTYLLPASMLSIALLSTTVASAEPGAKKARSHAAATEKAPALQGRFKYAGPKSEKEAITKTVDDTVAGFDEKVRPQAKAKLDAKTHIPSWVELKQNGSQVTVHVEGREPEVCSLEGATQGKDPEGNAAEFKLRRDGANLIQTITTSEGSRVNTFEPQPDGALKLKVELNSPRFKTPLRYALTYRPSK